MFRRPRYRLLLCMMVLAMAPAASAVRAESCVPSHSGTCNGHPPCDSANTAKHCRDTLTKEGYICECRTGKDMRGHRAASICREDQACAMEGGAVTPQQTSVTPAPASGGPTVVVPVDNGTVTEPEEPSTSAPPGYPPQPGNPAPDVPPRPDTNPH